MLRAQIVLSQTEDRDSDYFKSRFRVHPVLEVRAVHPKIGRAAEYLGRRAGHAGS